jgi:hypothetical protein
MGYVLPMSMIEPIEAIPCQIGETLIVAVAADRVYVASRDDEGVSEPVLMLTPDEAHLLGTKLRLAARKGGRS